MSHLDYLPDSSSYSATYGSGVISTDLDGGMPRLRRDQIDSPERFSVSWRLSADDFQEFMFFFRSTIDGGSIPFTMYLLLHDSFSILYEVILVPGSLKVDEARGLSRSVSAQLIGSPVDDYKLIDEAISAFGSTPSDFLQSTSYISDLANIYMPSSLNA